MVCLQVDAGMKQKRVGKSRGEVKTPALQKPRTGHPPHPALLNTYGACHPPTVCSYDGSIHTRGVARWALQCVFGNARVKQYCRMPEDGAGSKGDGETAIGLWRRNMLPTCRFADIHAAWLSLFQLPYVNFPCPAARLLTHLASDHYLLLGTAPSTFADLNMTTLEA